MGGRAVAHPSVDRVNNVTTSVTVTLLRMVNVRQRDGTASLTNVPLQCPPTTWFNVDDW